MRAGDRKGLALAWAGSRCCSSMSGQDSCELYGSSDGPGMAELLVLVAIEKLAGPARPRLGQPFQTRIVTLTPVQCAFSSHPLH